MSGPASPSTPEHDAAGTGNGHSRTYNFAVAAAANGANSIDNQDLCPPFQSSTRSNRRTSARARQPTTADLEALGYGPNYAGRAHTSTTDAFYGSGDLQTGRDDLAVRRHVRDMIAEVMTSNTDPVNVVEILELCRQQCQAAGVPFETLLDEDIEAFAAPPLAVEIMRCEWEDEDDMPPTLAFLLAHANSRKKGFLIRKAAAMRGADAIFQRLRHYIPHDSFAPGTLPVFDPEVDLDTSGAGFVMRLQVEGFAAVLRDAPMDIPDRARDKTPIEAAGSAEFIAAGRAWELRIAENALTLKLVQGDAADVDARCIVLAQEPHELLLPRATLFPLSASGQHFVTLKPCFSSHGSPAVTAPSSFVDPLASLDDGELILELHVKLGQVAGASSTGNRPDAPSVPSELPDGEWETIVTPKEDDGWVKASWSGKDEDF